MDEHLKTVDEIVQKYAVVSNPIKSKIYVSLGLLFVIFSLIGILIPGGLLFLGRFQLHFCSHYPMRGCSGGH